MSHQVYSFQKCIKISLLSLLCAEGHEYCHKKCQLLKHWHEGTLWDNNTSILLVPVRIMNELPMKLLGFLCVELLPTIRTLEITGHLDPHVSDGAIAGLGSITDLHRLRHRPLEPH